MFNQMKSIIKKSYSDTEAEVGRQVGRREDNLDLGSKVCKSPKKWKLKSKRKVKRELQRSLSANAQEERERERLRRSRLRLRAQGSLESPYNTPYQAVSGGQSGPHLTSPDPQTFYSQTDSQLEDFVGREFRKDYELQLYQRLERMSKEMLMSEYFLMERKIEQLEQKISEDQRREEEGQDGTSQSFGLINVFPLIQRLAEQFNILKSQNEKLLGQNSALSHKLYSISV